MELTKVQKVLYFLVYLRYLVLISFLPFSVLLYVSTFLLCFSFFLLVNARLLMKITLIIRHFSQGVPSFRGLRCGLRSRDRVALGDDPNYVKDRGWDLDTVAVEQRLIREGCPLE